MARLKRAGVSQELLQDMFTEGWKAGTLECTKGVPPGARIVGSSHDPQSMVAYLFFEHISFDDLPVGAAVPELVIEHASTE